MDETKTQTLPAWRRIGMPIVALVAVVAAGFLIFRAVKSMSTGPTSTVAGATESANKLHESSTTAHSVVPPDVYAAFKKKAIGMGGGGSPPKK